MRSSPRWSSHPPDEAARIEIDVPWEAPLGENTPLGCPACGTPGLAVACDNAIQNAMSPLPLSCFPPVPVRADVLLLRPVLSLAVRSCRYFSASAASCSTCLAAFPVRSGAAAEASSPRPVSKPPCTEWVHAYSWPRPPSLVWNRPVSLFLCLPPAHPPQHTPHLCRRPRASLEPMPSLLPSTVLPEPDCVRE